MAEAKLRTFVCKDLRKNYRNLDHRTFMLMICCKKPILFNEKSQQALFRYLKTLLRI